MRPLHRRSATGQNHYLEWRIEPGLGKFGSGSRAREQLTRLCERGEGPTLCASVATGDASGATGDASVATGDASGATSSRAGLRYSPSSSSSSFIVVHTGGPFGIRLVAATHRAPQDPIQHILRCTIHFAEIQFSRHERIGAQDRVGNGWESGSSDRAVRWPPPLRKA